MIGPYRQSMEGLPAHSVDPLAQVCGPGVYLLPPGPRASSPCVVTVTVTPTTPLRCDGRRKRSAMNERCGPAGVGVSPKF